MTETEERHTYTVVLLAHQGPFSICARGLGAQRPAWSHFG